MLGREGRSGAEAVVEVAGLAVDEVMAVVAAGLLVEVVVNAFPVAAPALSQGLGGETDAMMGLNDLAWGQEV